MFYNRKFELASVKARAYVALRDYEDLILATVEKIIPNATVVVKRDCYIVDRLTEGQSRKLGRALSKTKLIEHRQMVCRLFTGSEATESERIERNEKRKHKNVHRNQ